MRQKRSRLLPPALAMLISTLLPTQGQCDPLVDKLKAFIAELQADYKPLLTSTHRFMINSYFRDRSIDQTIVLIGIQGGVESIHSSATQIGSRLATAHLIAEDINAGHAPTLPAVPAYRTMFFDRLALGHRRAELSVFLEDARSLVALAHAGCTEERLAKIRPLFAPERFYTNNVFTVVVPRSVDFAWSVNATFNSDGTLGSVSAGSGTGQQLPPGYTQGEHAIAWAAGAAAATGYAYAAGLSYAAVMAGGTAAGPVGMAVVAIAYGVMSALKEADRVNAIHEQADLIRQAEQIHEDTLTTIRASLSEWVSSTCSDNAKQNASGIEALDHFLSGDGDKLQTDLLNMDADLQTTFTTIEHYIKTSLGQPDPQQLIISDVAKTLDRLLAGWTIQETAARGYWTDNIATLLKLQPAAPRPLPSGVMTEALEQTLDKLTIGDCQFARCYPVFDKPVPVEEEDKVSLAWLYLRNRAASAP